MMLLAVLAPTERAAGGMGWVVMMVMAMFGGGMVPLFALPQWMGSASHFSPVKWAILAFEGALWRGFTAAEIALPCAVLLAVGLVGMTAGILAFRFDR
jgi:ABC-2 type transport system permease protein